MSEVRRINPKPAPPPMPTFDIIGLSYETALALRTILYFTRDRSIVPGLEDLHRQLQDGVIGQSIVTVNNGNDFDITRRNNG